mmetsp:Transcript_16165/g.30688  ORF Transcript_16165/g.30688 Transcript_16165/m.30688 type:complete len:173 (-) Transcript_16165:181-699(-)
MAPFLEKATSKIKQHKQRLNEILQQCERGAQEFLDTTKNKSGQYDPKIFLQKFKVLAHDLDTAHKHNLKLREAEEKKKRGIHRGKKKKRGDDKGNLFDNHLLHPKPFRLPRPRTNSLDQLRGHRKHRRGSRDAKKGDHKKLPGIIPAKLTPRKLRSRSAARAAEVDRRRGSH